VALAGSNALQGLFWGGLFPGLLLGLAGRWGARALRHPSSAAIVLGLFDERSGKLPNPCQPQWPVPAVQLQAGAMNCHAAQQRGSPHSTTLVERNRSFADGAKHSSRNDRGQKLRQRGCLRACGSARASSFLFALRSSAGGFPASTAGLAFACFPLAWDLVRSCKRWPALFPWQGHHCQGTKRQRQYQKLESKAGIKPGTATLAGNPIPRNARTDQA